MAAVCSTVHAVSKVDFLDDRVAALRRVDAGIMTGPVLVPLDTSIIITGMKRVPDVDAGIKFSFEDPFMDVLG